MLMLLTSCNVPLNSLMYNPKSELQSAYHQAHLRVIYLIANLTLRIKNLFIFRK
jgi:hypothetical protein